MQTTVTMSTKLRRRNSMRSGPAKPHMPGFRRPHTRHSRASALVSRPHDGHRIEPDVLRNTPAFGVRGFVLGAGPFVGSGPDREAIALAEPHAQVDQTAGERAERPVRIALPRCVGAAGRTG